MSAAITFAVLSAVLLFVLFIWRCGWRTTLLLTLPCWLLLNAMAAWLFFRTGW